MFIILNMHLMTVFLSMSVRFFLHPFHQFLLYCLHMIHHVQDFHGTCIQRFHDFSHPLLHLPSVGHYKIRLLHGDYIGRGRLKRMAVHACGNYQLQLHPIACHLADKIIIRENGGHYTRPMIGQLLLFPTVQVPPAPKAGR